MLTNLEHLRDYLKENNHPAVTIVQCALDKSNSPGFIEGAANMLLQAAQADRIAQEKLVASLTQSLRNND